MKIKKTRFRSWRPSKWMWWDYGSCSRVSRLGIYKSTSYLHLRI